MSKLLKMWQKHSKEIDDLREKCKHPAKTITKHEDTGVVGHGHKEPAVHVICTECGTMKIVYGLKKADRKKVKKTMAQQYGGKDERCNLTVGNAWQLKLEIDGT